jgi:LuxR family maltose regulon positive regulatory protein
MTEPLTIEATVPRSARTQAAGRKTVVRTALLNRLCAATDVPVVAIVAPAGYGKTTLLAQWAERDARTVDWISIDERHDDARVLAATFGPAVEETGRLVLLDDVHTVREPEALAALGNLLQRIAPGTTVALAGRAEPQVGVARLRAEGCLLELGVDELALNAKETQSLLRRAGVLLPEPEATELRRRTEGWPAALYLAALSLHAGGAVSTFGGDDRFVADYLEAEHLARLSPAQRRFATRTSLLEELSADACDAVLERRDSRRPLAALERMRFVVPLDHRRRRYRYPRLVRDVLRAELEQTEPELVRSLHRRAAAWSEAHGAHEEALAHAAGAGDLDKVAELAARDALAAFDRGRLEALERRLALLHDHPGIERHADLCVVGSWVHALRGRPADAQHWGDAALRALDEDDPRLRLLRALRCRDGAEQMLDDAGVCCPALPPGDPWRPAALLALGLAQLLGGDAKRADRNLEEAVELASAAGATDVRIVGLCARALLAADRAEADALVDDARATADSSQTDPSAVHALLYALTARTAARRGDRDAARADAERADRLRPFLTYAVPWLAVLAALQLAHVRLSLADADGASELLHAVDEILHVRPRLGTLVKQTAELRRRSNALSDPHGRWASSLTSAETRLLPLLATHYSFREIGERLFVSRNTVKTQAISVYRKLGVSSRSEAIARAVDLGLIDEASVVGGRTPAGVG